MKIFLVGIKGSGMSALALYLNDLGHDVSGSDLSKYFFTEEKLIQKGIKIYDFSYKKYDEYDLIVRGNIINELKGSISYTEAINRFSKGMVISVAGTHGKTTTSTILSQLLNSNYIIGDGSGCYKSSQYFVLESCEYKDTFLKFKPDYSIITSIDYDHVDYFENDKVIVDSFERFISLSKKSIVCQDLLRVGSNNIIEYGLKNNIQIIKKESNSTTFKLNNKIYKTNLIGEHNISNLSGCILLLNYLKVFVNSDMLMNLKLPRLRFEINDYRSNKIILDYAHHPKEIEVTIKAAKQKFPNKEVILIFQPHTYSRSSAFIEEYKQIFKGYNTYVCPIFTSSREKNQKNDYFQGFKKYVKDFNIEKYQNSVILYMGAGDIYKYLPINIVK